MGGTKIEGVALDDDDNALVRLRAPTPRGEYRAIVETVAEVVGRVDAAAADQAQVLETVGVGHPGVVSPATGLVKNANSTALIGKPLHLDLTERLGRPVVLRNDADCFALSESTDGAAAGAETVFGVIIGTGVGGGVVVRGRLVEGPNAIAGEWGHNPLPWPSPDELPGQPCYCGKRGCIETWLSGPGLAADHLRTTGVKIEPPELLRLAGNGDRDASATVDRYIDRLARSLATIINVLDPEVIVLGGGLSNVPLLYDGVPRLWGSYVFSDRVTTRLVPNHHGDSSGVRGAAMLVRGRRDRSERRG
jgi:fructokinase